MAVPYVNGVYSDLNQLNAPNNELVFDMDSVYQSIGNILQTERGERFFRPDFGADLGRLLFEINDAGTEAMVEKIIVDAIEYIPDGLFIVLEGRIEHVGSITLEISGRALPNF